MTRRLHSAGFRFGFTAFASVALGATMLVPSSAGMRDRVKTKMLDNAADTMVSTIQMDSCPEFAAMMQSRKSGGDDSSSNKMKSDPAARQRFVDKVAGPLLNKMIDCDMLPSN